MMVGQAVKYVQRWRDTDGIAVTSHLPQDKHTTRVQPRTVLSVDIAINFIVYYIQKKKDLHKFTQERFESNRADWIGSEHGFSVVLVNAVSIILTGKHLGR